MPWMGTFSGATKKILGVLGFLLLIAALAPVVTERDDDYATVFLGSREFQLEIADTPSERARGLSGRSSIPLDGGILFLFDAPDRHTFWMKGMLFPIDILWVRGDTVVGVQEHVSPPPPGTPDALIERFLPPEPVDRVIEVRAGTVRELGGGAGQRISILVP